MITLTIDSQKDCYRLDSLKLAALQQGDNISSFTTGR
jgi:hypothetical protein